MTIWIVFIKLSQPGSTFNQRNFHMSHKVALDMKLYSGEEKYFTQACER